MAQRWRSRARRDPDLDDDDGTPPSQQPRRGRGGGGGSDEDEDDELGNEDLSLEIVARAQRKRRGVPGFADLLSVSSAEEEVDGDAVVELGEAEEPRRKQRKKQRRKQRKKQRKGATEAAAAAAVQGEKEVCGEPGVRAPGFAELLSVSSTDEEVDEDAVVELGEVEPRRKQRKKQCLKQRKKQWKEATKAAAAASAVEEEKEVCGTQEGPTGTAESVLTEDGADVPASDNRVLRKLLRIPRYFDPGETLLETCFNCSEEGHVAANCPMEKRKKPCFVCGLFGHNAKQCTQGQDCFICKKGGHMAKDCPDKHKRIGHQSTLCLRCGETGHDMFGCTNDYPQDDIKQIRCYVCNHNGHLCCTDFSDNCPKQISCYNCAQSGHSGLGCAKQRRETSVVTTPTLCYKCGEDGHFARGCTKNAKADWSKGKSSPHIKRKEKWKKDFSARSAPHDAHKASKRKSPHSEERMDTPRHKSKSRGGWTGGDDLEGLSFKKYKSNGGWGSPSTPKKPYTKHHPSCSGGEYTPRFSRRRNHSYTTPDSNYSPSASRKHGSSSSRFAVSGGTHIRFGRS